MHTLPIFKEWTTCCLLICSRIVLLNSTVQTHFSHNFQLTVQTVASNLIQTFAKRNTTQNTPYLGYILVYRMNKPFNVRNFTRCTIYNTFPKHILSRGIFSGGKILSLLQTFTSSYH